MGPARHAVGQSYLFTDITLSCQKDLPEITEKGAARMKAQYSTQGCGQAETDLGATCAHTGPGNVNQSHELHYYLMDKIKEQEQNGIIAIHYNRPSWR